MDNKWLNDPRFNSINPEKRQYLIQMMNTMTGKNMNEAMSIYIKTTTEMKNRGLALTKSEASLMVEYLMSNMTPEEVNKWNKIKAVLKL